MTKCKRKLFHKQGEYDESYPVHYYLAGYTLSVVHIYRYFRRLFAKNKTKAELMPIHLAYIVLFSYFCVAYKNSEFYYFFFFNSFDFSREDCSMCESYAIRKLQSAIYKKSAITGLHTSPFSHYHTL